MTAIFEQIAVLSEGVMRASQLSARQQDAKKSVKAVGHTDISKRNIKSELIEHPCRVFGKSVSVQKNSGMFY